jgi:hypothetical protein
MMLQKKVLSHPPTFLYFVPIFLVSKNELEPNLLHELESIHVEQRRQ